MLADAEEVEADLVREFNLGEQILEPGRRRHGGSTGWRGKHRRETVDAELHGVIDADELLVYVGRRLFSSAQDSTRHSLPSSSS